MGSAGCWGSEKNIRKVKELITPQKSLWGSGGGSQKSEDWRRRGCPIRMAQTSGVRNYKMKKQDRKIVCCQKHREEGKPWRRRRGSERDRGGSGGERKAAVGHIYQAGPNEGEKMGEEMEREPKQREQLMTGPRERVGNCATCARVGCHPNGLMGVEEFRPKGGDVGTREGRSRCGHGLGTKRMGKRGEQGGENLQRMWGGSSQTSLPLKKVGGEGERQINQT